MKSKVIDRILLEVTPEIEKFVDEYAKNISDKAQFACDILKQYADENGTFPRTTSDLSPLEQWLIVRLFNAPCSECNGTGRWKDDECDPEIDCPKCKKK